MPRPECRARKLDCSQCCTRRRTIPGQRRLELVWAGSWAPWGPATLGWPSWAGQGFKMNGRPISNSKSGEPGSGMVWDGSSRRRPLLLQCCSAAVLCCSLQAGLPSVEHKSASTMTRPEKGRLAQSRDQDRDKQHRQDRPMAAATSRLPHLHSGRHVCGTPGRLKIGDTVWVQGTGVRVSSRAWTTATARVIFGVFHLQGQINGQSSRRQRSRIRAPTKPLRQAGSRSDHCGSLRELVGGACLPAFNYLITVRHNTRSRTPRHGGRSKRSAVIWTQCLCPCR